MSLFLQVELSACHSKIKQEISAREKVEAQVLEVCTSLHSLSTPTYIHGLKIFQCNVNMKFPSSCGDIITLSLDYLTKAHDHLIYSSLEDTMVAVPS